MAVVLCVCAYLCVSMSLSLCVCISACLDLCHCALERSENNSVKSFSPSPLTWVPEISEHDQLD